MQDSEIVNKIVNGKIGVVPTDTLYGFSCSALNNASVERIYDIKQREKNKPFIVLISSIDSIKDFGINLTDQQYRFLQKNWPNCLTIVLDCPNEKFEYLHRGNNSIGFRMPKNQWLLDIIKSTGPITSTTINISGEPPITNVIEAQNKFGNLIDFIVDHGELIGNASTVIKLLPDATFTVLREGDAKIIV